MSFRESVRRTGGVLLAVVATGAFAAGGSSKPGSTAPVTPQSLRPTGPVTIDADHAEWVQNESMLYTGHVRLNSADLQLAGDRIELKQYPQGQFEAHITGDPATLNHKGLPNNDGTIGPPVTARSKTLNYDSRNGTVVVDGDALLTQGERQIQGDNILYNVANRRIEAKGAENGGQVHMVIPQPTKADPNGAGPATPAAPAASADGAAAATAAPAPPAAAPPATPSTPPPARTPAKP